MADGQHHFTISGVLKTLIFTALVAGLCYWFWQDTRQLLRPFKGDFWQLAKDMRILVNGAGVFIIVTLAGCVFDRSGARRLSTRLVMAAGLIGIVAVLIIQGRFFSKEIQPFLQAVIGT